MMNPGMYSSNKKDWETPQWLFDELDAEFHFTLDVCATPENAKCNEFYNPMFSDALQARWEGVCWMNPPYGAGIGRWVRYARTEGEHCTVVCLLPARTDTAWWQDYVIPYASEIRFLRGRLKFVGAESSAPFPSAVVIFKDVKR